MAAEANKRTLVAAGPGAEAPIESGCSVGVVPVLVSSADVRRKVDSVAELDDVLDGLTADGEPVLVELTGGSVVMNLGIGRQEAAVVLFRDADGRPWSARSGQGWSTDTHADLEFSRNGTSYRFYAHAAVAPSEMREAAREFVRTPGVKPSVLSWVTEGLGDDTSEEVEGGP